MAKNPGPGCCIHCGKYVEARNWDHVFPESWYPDSTPQNLGKWQVPSCIRCNREHGTNETDLLIRIGLCLDPEAPESAGIVARAFRAIDPAAGRNKKDSERRRAKRDQLRRQMYEGREIPTHGIYPGFGERWGRPTDEQGAIPVPDEVLQKLVGKIVRGLHFIDCGLYIEPPYSIQFHALNENSEIAQALELHGERFERGPGIDVVRILNRDDNISSFWRITIFARLVMYAFVERQQTIAPPHG